MAKKADRGRTHGGGDLTDNDSLTMFQRIRRLRACERFVAGVLLQLSCIWFESVRLSHSCKLSETLPACG
eukprot:1159436-Amphidinium_carterae.1